MCFGVWQPTIGIYRRPTHTHDAYRKPAGTQHSHTKQSLCIQLRAFSLFRCGGLILVVKVLMRHVNMADGNRTVGELCGLDFDLVFQRRPISAVACLLSINNVILGGVGEGVVWELMNFWPKFRMNSGAERPVE